MSALSLVLDTPALAQHYERVSADRQFKAGKQLINRLAVKPGEHVLDVGTGTGLLAEHVAGIVGSTGSVLGIDPLPLRIEIAKQRTSDNLSFRVGDAYALDALPDASFDVIYLNAVFHWLPEKLGPLSSFQRLLKPGGRLGISTGSKDHLNTIRAIRKRVLANEPYSAYPDSEEDVAHNVSVDELRELLVQTGFAVEQLELQPHVTQHASAQAALEFAQASSFGNFLGRLPASLQPSARAEILRELEQLRTPEGIRQEGARVLAVARKQRGS